VEVTATKGSSPTLSAETAALYGLDETGTVDEALKLLSNELGSAKIEYGQYVGTGVAGSESKQNSLTFSFAPKLLIVTGNGSAGDTTYTAGHGFYAIRGQSYCLSQIHYYNSTSIGQIKLSWSGQTVSWYAIKGGTTPQLAVSGETYFYVAFE
jgi:hypothetical protein